MADSAHIAAARLLADLMTADGETPPSWVYGLATGSSGDPPPPGSEEDASESSSDVDLDVQEPSDLKIPRATLEEADREASRGLSPSPAIAADNAFGRRAQATTRAVELTEVARSAGVSLATVGQVINARSSVSPATRRRVQAAMTELGLTKATPSEGSRESLGRKSNEQRSENVTLQSGLLRESPQNWDLLLDKQYQLSTLQQILDAPVEALAGVSASDAEALKSSFNIITVGDLGRNKYLAAAVALANLAADSAL